MARSFGSKYFEKNASKVFKLRESLAKHKIRNDEQLEEDEVARCVLRESCAARGNLSSQHCDSLRCFLRHQGGVDAFVRESALFANPYVAAAVYNLRIQKSINDLARYTRLDEPGAQLLSSDLLGEEGVADEAVARAYRALCRSAHYARAEPVVKNHVPSVTRDQSDLVKAYLRHYLKTGSAKYVAMHVALVHRQQNPKCGQVRDVRVKVERLAIAPGEVKLEGGVKLEEVEAEGVPSPSPGLVEPSSEGERAVRQESRAERRKLDRQRRLMRSRLVRIKRREAALAVREMVLNVREAAVDFREELLKGKYDGKNLIF